MGRAMARGLSRAERKISRRNAEVNKLKAEDAKAQAMLKAKAKLLRAYKRAMRSKLRKIKKVLWTKAQGNNKVWLRKALRKCHAAEVGLHNKWVKCTHKSKMALELCRRAGKVALPWKRTSVPVSRLALLWQSGHQRLLLTCASAPASASKHGLPSLPVQARWL